MGADSWVHYFSKTRPASAGTDGSQRTSWASKIPKQYHQSTSSLVGPTEMDSVGQVRRPVPGVA